MVNKSEELPVENPTYLGDIRYFFSPDDIDHMTRKGINLGTYDGLKTHAVQIYGAVSSGQMPPEPDRQWTEARSQTFLNWMSADFPMGLPTAGSSLFEFAPPIPQRVRGNAASMSAADIALLGKAFEGVMARDADDPQGYFALAGQHGLPNLYCQHHVDSFNPWHRIYLRNFEDALRSVEGCGDVTLPYWDILSPLPAFLLQPPFASYKFPRDIGDYTAGEETRRGTQVEIDASLARFNFAADFDQALNQAGWGKYVYDSKTGKVGYGFQQYSIQAHDGGHVSAGPTMAVQEYAAFDPIFWFYHCNLDRHWLSWQKLVHALDWSSFQSVLDKGTPFWKPPLNRMQPFPETNDKTIALGIGYDQLIMPRTPLNAMARRVKATSAFSIIDDSVVNVSIEGIERLKIPGSFVVNLLADGEMVGSRAFFQPKDPPGCPNCAATPVIGLQMDVPRAVVIGKTLSVSLEVPGQSEIGANFPLSQAGSPTVRVSSLLSIDR